MWISRDRNPAMVHARPIDAKGTATLEQQRDALEGRTGSRPVQTLGALLGRNLWNGSSSESGRSREGPRAPA
jgi:hypothetical protein